MAMFSQAGLEATNSPKDEKTLSNKQPKVQAETDTKINHIDTCVFCGAYVPEGGMVCSHCETDPFYVLKRREGCR